ncbi:MAG: ABC transporter permease [Acidobacteria bacterium]|nr:MAG: ABC transporter permease [Acidobacteriota bacterium]
MNYVALRMLTGDRAKYLSLIFAIAFSTFLLENQSSIFAGIMKRTTSQILDVTDADVWVMDKKTLYIDEVKALTENDLYRVRGVPGVLWAVRLFKGQPRAKAADGTFRVVVMMGVDDASLVGAPSRDKMILGSVEDLRQPDSVIIDRAGYKFLFPGQPLDLGRTLELNDHLVRIVGIAEASAPFATFPVMFSRYSQAIKFVGRERDQLSFVLVKPQPGIPVRDLCDRIEKYTDLRAVSGRAFAWQTVFYYVKNTGIPVNFGITIGIALIVGAVVAGQTFYIFTIENLKQFGALKAIGVTNGSIVGMILLQALTVAAIGYSIGSGIAGVFFSITLHNDPTRGLVLLWQNMAGVAVAIFFVVFLASLLSVRRVLTLEPAVVFRG